MYLLAAISIGLAGSLHCVGMCGPIMLAMNRGTQSKAEEFFHHLGRLTVYVALGIVAGALGASFNAMGWQQGFSLVVGSMLILSVAALPLVIPFNGIASAIGRMTVKLVSHFHRAGLTGSTLRFVTGLANGFLPCGLVYLALAGAANTFTPWDGAMFMAVFAVGTIPALYLVSKAGRVLSVHIRDKMRKLIPVTVLVMGILLVIRGMNLGIPYLSPQNNVQSEQTEQCN